MLSIIGIIVGLVAILGGNFLEGGSVSSLLNLPALLIVLGGTLGATLLHFSAHILFNSIKALQFIIKPRDTAFRERIQSVVAWSQLARKEGLLGLEKIILHEEDDFTRKGLQLLIDGGEPELIRSYLDVELNTIEYEEIQAAKVYEAMGGYAPTIGIVGAVIGLIHVMQNLSDPSQLGAGIAAAFVATIYGVGFANLLFLPIANKLKAQAYILLQSKEMIQDGIVAIAEGENPKNIELKLSGYVARQEANG
jgi:chemotaxis protein MotA